METPPRQGLESKTLVLTGGHANYPATNHCPLLRCGSLDVWQRRHQIRGTSIRHRGKRLFNESEVGPCVVEAHSPD
ncbi:hypothetical protein P4O66_014762, partial [Electrophorus voltai]